MVSTFSLVHSSPSRPWRQLPVNAVLKNVMNAERCSPE